MEDNIPDDNSLSDENNDTEEKEDNEFENMLKQVREEKNKKTSKEKTPKTSFQQQLLELHQNQLQSIEILRLFYSHEHSSSNYCLTAYKSGASTEWVNLTEKMYFPTKTSQRACAKMKS